MTTIRAFFLQIGALFSNFEKRAGENSPPPPPPSSYVPGLLLTMIEYFFFKKAWVISKKLVMSYKLVEGVNTLLYPVNVYLQST